ncbi:MAG: hypothetical protein JO356_11570, partial [Acidobacteria bacterium]|nr:hypothetical protein [Acidobacteriota bacterium]
QYYQEEANAAEVRIEVQPGSYVPQFRKLPTPPLVCVPGPPVDLSHDKIITLLPAGAGQSASWLWVRRIAYVLIPVMILARVLFYIHTDDPVEGFWGPVLSSRTPILLCVGNIGAHQTVEDQKPTGQPMTLLDFHELPSETVHVADAATLSRVARFMAAKGKAVQIVAQSEATYTDLQNGPAVLIGLMNNDWTVRLVQKLRFTVERLSGEVVLIRDHENPSRTDWAMDYSMPYLDVTKDYALVLRVKDPKTEQMVVAIAGISVFGTTAAGEFLTNANDIKKIQAVAPPGWEHKNLELVLSTDVIRGKPGRASIIATSFW